MQASSLRCWTVTALLITLSGLGLRAAEGPATWHVSLQLHSLHWGVDEDRDDITNNTPGIGLLRRTEDHWLAGAGVFRNSLGRTAGYGYGGKQWALGRRVLAGGILGLTHRYNANDGGIVPLAAAVVTVPINDRLALEFVGIPEVGDYSYNTLNFSVSWRL